MAEQWVMRLTNELDRATLIKLAREGREPVFRYLRDYDPDAHGGRGSIRETGDLAKAKRFDSIEAVFAEWKRQSTVVPYRADGKPNRPLTAFTMEPRRID